MLIAPVCAVAVTFFVLGLPFGRGVTWNAQQRDAEGLPLRAAARRLWLQTVLGIVLAASCWYVAPGVVWFWAPLIAGLAGAIPLAMLTAHPWAGRALIAAGVCRVPEEKVPPDATWDRPRTLASDFEPGTACLASLERSS
jgi:membrane glycosyltransferase